MSFLETTAKLILLRCDAVLKQRGNDMRFKNFSLLKMQAEELREDEVRQWIEEVEAPNEGSIEAQRYSRILDIFERYETLQSLLDIAIAAYIIPEFEPYIEANFGLKNCLELAGIVEGEKFVSEADIAKYARLASMVFDIDLKDDQIRYAAVNMSSQLMAYISGVDELDSLLSGSSVYFSCRKSKLHDLFVSEDIAEKGTEWLKDTGDVVQLCGTGGKQFLAKHIAGNLQKDFLLVDMDAFIREASSDRKKYINAIKKELVLKNLGVCFWNISEQIFPGERNEGRNLENIVFAPLMRLGVKQIICTDSEENVFTEKNSERSLMIKLPEKLSYKNKVSIWEGLAKFYEIELNTEDFVARYALSASEVSKAMKEYKKLGLKDTEKIADICSSIALRKGANSVGRVIFPIVKLDDVKLKPELKEEIGEVMMGARGIRKLIDKWNLSSLYPYGRSVCALMTGGPGTGKTMTANAIAFELGMPLFQVNISEIMDKYIGETEKNLEKAFQFAEKTNAILFFDEADSIFGKRTEVSETKDRYANNEISFLLQRIEAFDGIVIMATNIMGNIDPAFLRRIRYVLHFENPDLDVRREIWRSCVTSDVPHGDIDIDYLAEQFSDFTGSVIKTVFLNACASAAGKGEELGMEHLLRAISREIRKTTSITLQPEALGRYAYLMR